MISVTKLKGIISLILTLSLISGSIFLFSPINSYAMTQAEDVEIYRKVENDYKKIALTFDDGPHPRYTPQILEILDQYNVKATFFIIGVNASYYPDTLERIIESGHEIGNHTYSHPHVSSINANTLREEIEHCEAVINGSSDYKTKLFRPPEGMIDGYVKDVLKDLDYKVVLWDIDTRDWAHTPPEEISENVVSHVSSGDIILMHDYISFGSPTPEALRLFIPKLLDKGYRFVVMSELIGSS